MQKVNFLDEICVVTFGRYAANGQIKIQLWCEDGQPMASATSCLPDVDFTFGGNANGAEFTAIKDYSENTGILDALVEAGIVRRTNLSASGEFVSFPIVEVLVEV